jgi:hypothetical protein
MAKIVATVTDAVNSMIRRLGGNRLCEYCRQWAAKPHQSGGFYFCDNIHAAIYFKKQQELMKQALEKKKNLEKQKQEPG